MSQVRLSNMSKEYDGGILTVEGLGLIADGGEFVVVAGLSGCGKLTTLRMVARLETVTGDEIAIGKYVVNDVRPQDRNTAAVFQPYALYSHMTVRKNMSFGLYLARKDDDEVRGHVEDAAEMLEISGLSNNLLKQLSGGQQQRIALGRATMYDPDVFLMGEPLSNLGAKLRAQIRAEIQWIQEDLGVMAVYVTYDQTEAMMMANRIVTLNGDKPQQVGPPKRCYDKPNNESVVGFIGSPSVNFFEMTATDGNGGARLESPSFEFTLDVDALSGEYTPGVRPEGFAPDYEGGYVETVIDVVELVGLGNFLYLQTTYGLSEVVARVESELRPVVGDEIAPGFGVDDMYLFGSDNAHAAVSETRLADST